jgi:hypothetical protein
MQEIAANVSRCHLSELHNNGSFNMKLILIAAAVAAATITTTTYAADVGVSVSIGQPGFYGRIDIGNFPQPAVINAQPVIVQRGAVERPPIYLRVPPGHARHWSRHCREYNACGERVFFVQDGWYNREYAPRYQEEHRDRREERRDERRDDRRDEGRGSYEDRRDEGRDGDRRGNSGEHRRDRD